MRVLYLEPDASARRLLEPELVRRGLQVEWAATELAAFDRLRSDDFDALIADANPGEAFQFIGLLRAAGVDTPAISLVSGEGTEAQGGSDPHTFQKPFGFDELVLRIHGVARRRTHEPPDGCLRVHDLELDLRGFDVERGGVVLDLSPPELAVLEYLMRNVGRVLTRSMIAENAPRGGQRPEPEEVERHIRRLRLEIDRDFDPPLLHNESGGYVLEYRENPPQATALPVSA